MSSCHNYPDFCQNIFRLDDKAFLEKLLAAPRPNSGKIRAFFDSRVCAINTNPALLLLPLDDHMCHRGDGLFESINYRERKIFALGSHLDRLASGLAILNITSPIPLPMLPELICKVAEIAGEDHGELRLFISRGPGGFGVSPKECPQSSLYIVALTAALPASALYEKGLTAFTSTIPPKQEYLAKIKNTNYLPNVFMAQEALQKNMDVAITFDEKGNLAEAAIANVAIVDEHGVFRSPEIRNILPGTTLIAALEIAASRMPVYQGPIKPEEILKAREMLLLTSSSLCVAITSFDETPIANGKPGPVALWLKDQLLDHLLATGTPF